MSQPAAKGDAKMGSRLKNYIHEIGVLRVSIRGQRGAWKCIGHDDEFFCKMFQFQQQFMAGDLRSWKRRTKDGPQVDFLLWSRWQSNKRRRT